MDQPEFDQFATTHWTAIRACAQTNGAGIVARHELSRHYWYPIYAHLRQKGHSGHEASNLTRQFFAQLNQSPWFIRADPDAGRFRVFLLHRLEEFRKACLDPARVSVLENVNQPPPLDLSQAEARYAQNASGKRARAVYDVEWAKSIAQAALDKLAAEYAASGRQAVFQALKKHLTARRAEAGYESTAAALQIPLEAVREGIRRLHNRYGTLLREEIARTVGVASEMEAEIKHLRGVMESD